MQRDVKYERYERGKGYFLNKFQYKVLPEILLSYQQLFL